MIPPVNTLCSHLSCCLSLVWFHCCRSSLMLSLLYNCFHLRAPLLLFHCCCILPYNCYNLLLLPHCMCRLSNRSFHSSLHLDNGFLLDTWYNSCCCSLLLCRCSHCNTRLYMYGCTDTRYCLPHLSHTLHLCHCRMHRLSRSPSMLSSLQLPSSRSSNFLQPLPCLHLVCNCCCQISYTLLSTLQTCYSSLINYPDSQPCMSHHNYMYDCSVRYHSCSRYPHTSPSSSSHYMYIL